MSMNCKYIICTFLFCLGLTACTEDLPNDGFGDISRLEGTLPVEFEVSMEDFATRATETAKTKFQEGDVIHIEAEFYKNDDFLGRSYGALKLINSRWIQANGPSLIWPNIATKGRFRAFYMQQSDGVLQPGTSTDAVLLSELDGSTTRNGWDLDPLCAENTGFEVYGHAVTLQFKHVCTHVTFINLDPGVTDFFWLVNHNHPSSLNNAFRLKLDEDKRLSIEFEVNDRSKYGDDISYIASTKVVNSDYTDDDGVTSTRSSVSFFLEPGDYSSIDLRTNNNTSYLLLQSEDLLNLEAHTPYVIDVMKSSGITFITKDDSEWAEDDAPYEVNVKDFIQNAVEGNDYWETDDNGNRVDILEAINNGVKLLRNIRFPDDQLDYDDRNMWGSANQNFVPNITAGRVFEGDHHYISNVKQPLFQYNSGTIQNLGLKEVNCNVTLKYTGEGGNDFKKDRSRKGAVCFWNRSGGVIQNIRIEGLNIVSSIYYKEGDNDPSLTTDVAHKVGAICGENSGTISDVAFSGDVYVSIVDPSVTNRGKTETVTGKVNAEINLGGIVGENAGNLYRVLPLDGKNLSVTVINECTGDAGVFSVGGAVGYCGGVIENVSLPYVNVDCSKSDAFQTYTGGLAGRLRGSDNSLNLVSACSVGGEVKTGIISQYSSEMNDSYSYTGGLIGSTGMFNVRDCSTTCAVAEPTTIDPTSTYCTGGIIGAVIRVNNINTNSLFNLTGWNTSLEGSHNPSNNEFLGRFAGTVPPGETWNNYSGNGIYLREFSNITQEIGGNK